MRALICTTIVSMFLVACAAQSDELTNGTGDEQRGRNGANGANGDGTTPGADPTQPGFCKEGDPHVGFASTNFIADRKVGGIGVERRRVKPFGALRTDFQRALGRIPAAMNASAAAYGEPPARWYAEPTAGAVSLNTTYSLAFTGCYDSLTGANYGTAPTAETAATECSTMQRKFWQRSPTPEETQACVDFLMGLTTEPVARRRWSHGCASIMTSAGFTTY